MSSLLNRSDDDREVKYISDRLRMVDRQLAKRGITDAAVLAAMRTVPRHLFIPEQYRDAAYDDGPQSIGEGQTISQPYIVASMTEHLDLNRESKVLEIGTGCGYQTAILAEITRHVYSIERIAPLLLQANRLLDKLGYSSIHTKLDDGGLGWPEEAPFDAIIVTAAATRIPQTLVRQLAEDGRMVIPVETGVGGRQELIKVSRTAEGISEERLYEVRFVPLCTDVKE